MITNNHQLKTFFNNRRKLGIKPGLDRMNLLLDLLDNPQDKVKAIHVAGTNGKGSTISYLKNALVFNGYRVGVFTSPSLDGLRGHIYCNEQKITSDLFLSLFQEMYPVICKLDEMGKHPTEFEIITVLAFLSFSNNVDIALIETGMGGREDTTNCFEPLLSIITNIDFDHKEFLGKTISEIADHKAGIIKEKTPIVTGEYKKEALQQIEKVAYAMDAPIYQLHKDFHYTYIQKTRTFQQFTWNSDLNKQLEIIIHMHGEHQVKNCTLALMALAILDKNEMMIVWNKAIEGIRDTLIPGRFELLQKEKPIIILDGAHNVAGIESFLKTIHTYYGNEEKHLLFAAFKDKDLKHMLDLLSPHFTSITVTTFDHPRAANSGDLYCLLERNQKYKSLDWKKTINKLIQSRDRKDPLYFITGSLNFIGEVRNHFKQ